MNDIIFALLVLLATMVFVPTIIEVASEIVKMFIGG